MSHGKGFARYGQNGLTRTGQIVHTRAMDFRTIIEQWPSPQELAADLGCQADAVQKWKQRNSIPSSHWLKLLGAAKSRRIRITPDTLVKAAGEAA